MATVEESFFRSELICAEQIVVIQKKIFLRQKNIKGHSLGNARMMYVLVSLYVMDGQIAYGKP
jgi:hypothetical protein